MKNPSIGSMRDMVAIQSRTLALSSFGEPSPTWATLATVAANVMDESSREVWQAQQIQSDVTHVVRIRYYPGVTPKNQLIWLGSTLNIKSVLNGDGRQRFMEILCVQVT